MLERMPAGQLSVRELAREAGISHAAPYKHFGDRHGFLVALAAGCMAEFLDAQRQAVTGAAPGERLLRLGEAYVRYGAAHPHAFALIFDTEVSPPTDPPAALAPLIASHAALLHDAITDALHAGQLPTDVDPAVLGAALWSQAHGLAHLVITGRIPPARITTALAAFLRPANSPTACERRRGAGPGRAPDEPAAAPAAHGTDAPSG
jgi:AcrR family transcriptional regulator